MDGDRRDTDSARRCAIVVPQVVSRGSIKAVGLASDTASQFYVSDLGGNVRFVGPATGIDEVLVELGHPLTGIAFRAAGPGSWTEQAQVLRDREDLGPFRLAYLETLVRVADWRSSARHDGPVPPLPPG